MSGLVFNRGGGINAPVLTAIIVSKLPIKTTYNDGEHFDPSGMEVSAVYSDGSTTVCTGYMYYPDTALTVGQSVVTITYSEGGVTAQTTVLINVIPMLVSVEIVRGPTKTIYEVGESFDPTPMLLRATYSDGSTKTVDQTEYVWEPAVLGTRGRQQIDISYEDNGVTAYASNSVTVYETISIPIQSGTLTYNGSILAPTWTGYDANKMTLGGITSAQNAGSYDATFTPALYCRWGEDNYDAVTVAWSIAKAAGSLTLSAYSLSLSSDNLTGTITVTRAGDGAITAQSSSTQIAEVNVSGNAVTVTGKASGSAAITVSVAEGTNHLAPANVTCNVVVDIQLISDNFADNTWADIIDICNDHETNETPLPAGWTVGSTKSCMIDGTEYALEIIGIDHDRFFYSNTKAALTLCLKDCYGTEYRMHSSSSNSTGWVGTEMQKTTLPAIYELIEADLKAGIKEVLKKTASKGNLDEDEDAPLEDSCDKLFLLSAAEIFNLRSSDTDVSHNEGNQYEYYVNGNSPIKYYDGTAAVYYTRTPMLTSRNYCTVKSSGDRGSSGALQTRKIAFALCL